MTPEAFRAQIAGLTAQLAGRPLDSALDTWLNQTHGTTSATYAGLKAACEAAEASSVGIARASAPRRRSRL